jgi:nocturnin
VVILAILRHKVTGREICVATTHLKARQGALLSTLRNEQGKDILDFLHEHVHNRPLVVCGDFNAEPSEPVYSTILSDERFDFHSAYRTLDGQEPAYTTWKIRGEGETCHTIDYVFYSRNHFNVQQLLAFPTGHQVGPNRVPSFQYPSDHFSLVVDFQWTPPATSSLPATASVSSNLLCI